MVVIKKITLENFKAFKYAEIEIKPITILVGPNNSGKTSILQSIRLIQETLSGSSTNILKFNGDFDFGDFDTICNQKSEKKEISFKFDFEDGKYFGFTIIEQNGKLCVKKFECDNGAFENIIQDIIEQENEKDGSIYYNPSILIFNSKKYDKKLIETFNPYFKREHFFFLLTPSSADFSELENIVNKMWQKYKPKFELDEPQFTTKFLKTLQFYMNIEKYSRNFYQDIKQHFENIKYIGPIRDTAKRDYPTGSSNYVGIDGKYAVQMIENDLELRKKTEHVLQDMEVANEFKFLKRTTPKKFEFKLQTDITDSGVNFADVGCGTSQLLPFIVQSLTSSDNSMIVIEQPEAHLHPKIQADLASFMVDSLEPNKKFLIETHSEYFIERLRTCIMKNPMLSEKIIIYYVEQNKDNEQSEIINIEINSKGQYSTLPKGYLTNFRLNEIDVQMDLTLSKLKNINK